MIRAGQPRPGAPGASNAASPAAGRRRREGSSRRPCRRAGTSTTGPAYDAARAAWTAAWDGTAPVDIGIGGSIPCVATFQKRFEAAAILVTGIEDTYCAAHGPNESLHLAEFARTCLAEAFLLRNLAEL
jgi:acetylornithine deacetylase/succinyl-diaminopimelate desuccinylase-like protein